MLLIDKAEELPLSNNQCSKLSNKFNLALARVIVKNNMSLRIMACPEFRELIHKSCPAWKLASRMDMSVKYIGHLARSIQNNFIGLLNICDDFTLAVEFDHWQDLSRRSILAIVITFHDGRRYLLRLCDVSIHGHSTKATLKCILDTLSTIPSRKINSILSDSASSCKATRERFIKEDRFTLRLLIYGISVVVRVRLSLYDICL